MLRRQFLRQAAAVAVAALACGPRQLQPSPGPRGDAGAAAPRPGPGGQVAGSDAELVAQAAGAVAAELRIEPSPEEIGRWEMLRNTGDPSAFLNATLTQMYHSQNPGFRDAAAGYKALLDGGRVDFQLASSFTGEGRTNMGVVSELAGDRIAYRVYIGVGRISATSATQLALDLVHEQRHLANWEALDPSLTGAARLEALSRRGDDPEAHLAEEASGYAAAAEAFLIQYALGYREPPGGFETQRAAAYVRAGRDQRSPRWRAAILPLIDPDVRRRLSPSQ